MKSGRIQTELRQRPLTMPVRTRTLQTSGGGVLTAESVPAPQECSPNAAKKRSTSRRGPVSLCRNTGNGFWLGFCNFPGPSFCACAVADWNGRVLLRRRTGPCSNPHSNSGAAGAPRNSPTAAYPGSQCGFSNRREACACGIHAPQSSARSHAECREQGSLDTRPQKIARISGVGAINPDWKVRGFPSRAEMCINSTIWSRFNSCKCGRTEPA